MSDKVKLRVDLTSKENVANKVTSITSSSTNTHYPTAKAVYDTILEVVASSSGDSIYDFYFDSSHDDIVLEYDSASGGGSGDGGSSVDIITTWGQTLSDEKVPSEKLVKNSLDGKAESSSLSTVATTGSYNDLTNKPTNSWELVETQASNQVKVYVNDNMVALSIQDSFTLTANSSTTIATISSQYAPTHTLTTPYHLTAPDVHCAISPAGVIEVRNNTTSTSLNARIYVTYPLKSRMP